MKAWGARVRAKRAVGRAVRGGLVALALFGLTSLGARTEAAPVAVAIFAGQSNEVSHGTDPAIYGLKAIPGAAGRESSNWPKRVRERVDLLPLRRKRGWGTWRHDSGRASVQRQ